MLGPCELCSANHLPPEYLCISIWSGHTHVLCVNCFIHCSFEASGSPSVSGTKSQALEKSGSEYTVFSGGHPAGTSDRAEFSPDGRGGDGVPAHQTRGDELRLRGHAVGCLRGQRVSRGFAPRSSALLRGHSAMCSRLSTVAGKLHAVGQSHGGPRSVRRGFQQVCPPWTAFPGAWSGEEEQVVLPEE